MPQRARSQGRGGRKTARAAAAAYREPSLVSAVMLARIGPVKPFLDKELIAHSEACGSAEMEPPTRSPLRRIGGEPGRAKGTHRYVSAVSAEIVGGTLPEKRFSPRALCRSVPVRRAEAAERPHGRRRRRTGSPAW